MRNAFLRHRIAVMADDEAHGMAVGGDEVLHALFEFGIVERLRRQVERVVILGGVERLAHGVGVLCASFC